MSGKELLFVISGSIALDTRCVVARMLPFRFHHDGAEAFPLGESNSGELHRKFLTLHPPNDGLLHTQRPLMIREKQ